MSDSKGTSSQGQGELPSRGQYDFSHLRGAHPTTAAFAYVEKDWTLVPVDVPTGKVVLPEGVDGASRDVETVLGWADEPGVAVGIATGRRCGVVAVRWKGELGRRAIQVLQAQNGAVATLEAASDDGSRLLLFRAPAEAINSREQVVPGLDFMGEGGFFVPCHSSWGTDSKDLADLPDWLHSIIMGSSTFGAKELAVAGVFEALNDATQYDAALAYRALGFKVLKVEEKAETIPPKGKTRKREEVRKDNPAKLGILTGSESGIVVLMVASVFHLEKYGIQSGQLPAPRFYCPGSFEVYCFKAPREPFPSQLLSPGVKYLGEGDTLPVPPAVIPHGELRWREGAQLQRGLPELPLWLYGLLERNQHQVQAALTTRTRPAKQKPAREPSSELRKFALGYASKGLPVFPLKPNSAEPLFKKASEDATTDPETISRWWGKVPLANIGVRTGGTSGVAALVADGQTGVQSLAELEGLHGTIQTPRAQDASGGLLLLFDLPVSGVASCTSFLPGLDFLSDGRFAVLPPSRVGGQGYRWLEQARKEKSKVPDWLLALVDAQVQSGMSGVTASTAAHGFVDRRFDRLDAWLEERCEKGRGLSEKATVLLTDFSAWSGEDVTPQLFGRLLGEKGFEKKKASILWYLGLCLKET